jgi:UDP-glucuronate decarboxylase
MLELASIIIELTGSKSELIHMPLPVDDPKQRRPDIDVARLRYGWTPKTQLRDGLSRTIEYFDKLFKKGVIR